MKKYTLENENTKTKTGIELLRVLAMLWIIMFHYANHESIDIKDRGKMYRNSDKSSQKIKIWLLLCL